MTELSIDTASETASVALSAKGKPIAEITWRCCRNHSVELLPAIDRLLDQAAATRAGLTAVFVCLGPGLYTGLRVGITTAKGAASALGLPLLGVGRLELDAYPHAAFPGAVVAVHKAGRGELAWAAYAGAPWRELEPPQLSTPEALSARLSGPTLVVGETDEALVQQLRSASGQARIVSEVASLRRAGTLAELGFERLCSGAPSDPATLRPVYLRPPAIGPQDRAQAEDGR